MADDNSTLQITIDVVDSSGSIQTINATTAAVQGLGTAGTKAGADLGAVGAGASTAAAQVNDLGNAGGSSVSRMAARITAARAEAAALAAQASAASQQITEAGTAGTAAGSSVAAGMEEASRHVLTTR